MTELGESGPPRFVGEIPWGHNLKLRCFVVVELKNGPFKPEYAGKMSVYLSAVDDRALKGTLPSVGQLEDELGPG